MRRGDSDRAWGRMPGARPPIGAWVPVAWWVASAVTLTVVVALVVREPGPLDDPDPADQRTGFLVSSGEATKVANLAVPGDPVGQRPVVVFFDRRVPPVRPLTRVANEVPQGVDIVLVVPRASAVAAGAVPPRVRLLTDRSGRVARAVRIHRPVDRGRPVGYAVIDRQARVRYVTLEPSYLDHRLEINLVAKAAK